MVVQGRSHCSFTPLDGPAEWRAVVLDAGVDDWQVSDRTLGALSGPSGSSSIGPLASGTGAVAGSDVGSREDLSGWLLISLAVALDHLHLAVVCVASGPSPTARRCVDGHLLDWPDVVELGDLSAGRDLHAPRRSFDQQTASGQPAARAIRCTLSISRSWWRTSPWVHRRRRDSRIGEAGHEPCRLGVRPSSSHSSMARWRLRRGLHRLDAAGGRAGDDPSHLCFMSSDGRPTAWRSPVGSSGRSDRDRARTSSHVQAHAARSSSASAGLHGHRSRLSRLVESERPAPPRIAKPSASIQRRARLACHDRQLHCVPLSLAGAMVFRRSC